MEVRLSVCLSLLLVLVLQCGRAFNPGKSKRGDADTHNWRAFGNDIIDGERNHFIDRELETHDIERELELTTDDDRHNGDFNENDAGDGPGNPGYTSVPSDQPSAVPTSSPSLIPSKKPSIIPTGLPSSSPSSSPTSTPSLDHCKVYNGNFGTVTESSTVVSFKYWVESDLDVMDDMKASLSDLILGIERDMLGLLAESIFMDCSEVKYGDETHSRSRQLNIFASPEEEEALFEQKSESVLGKIQEDAKIILSSEGLDDATEGEGSIIQETGEDDVMRKEITGLTSSPQDLANGDLCTGPHTTSPDFNATCYIIEGRVKIFLTDTKFFGQSTSMILRNVRDIMNAEKLHTSHPAILSVVYLSSKTFLNPVDGNDETDDDIVTTSPNIDVRGGNLLVWAAGVSLTVYALLVAARGMYARRHGDDYLSGDEHSPNSSVSESLVGISARRGSGIQIF